MRPAPSFRDIATFFKAFLFFGAGDSNSPAGAKQEAGCSENLIGGRTKEDFRNHPEAKSAGPEGEPSNTWTVGLLGGLPVQAFTVIHIGKKTNLLEQQEEGILVDDPQEIYRGRDEWEALCPWLSRVRIRELATRSGVSERALRNLRRADRRPCPKTVGVIFEALCRLFAEAQRRKEPITLLPPLSLAVSYKEPPVAAGIGFLCFSPIVTDNCPETKCPIREPEAKLSFKL